MVHHKSVYQNEFKSSIVKDHHSTYLENLTFRHHRRDREFLHTPINWWVEEDDEEEQSSDNNDNHSCNNARSKSKVSDEPQYQSLAEILTESNRKNKEFRQNKGKSTAESDIDIGRISLDSEVPISKTETPFSETIEANKDCNQNEPTKSSKFLKSKVIDDFDTELYDEDENKLTEKDSKSLTSHSKKCSKKSISDTRTVGQKLKKGSSKPKRPDRQGVIPGTTGQFKSTVDSSIDRPPFISYGVGDRESTLAMHRTHNVRSSVDVYAQALKAQRLRDADKRRRQKEKQRAAKSASALMDKLAAATQRDHQPWQSEYRKQFHGYEPQEYERAMSARAVIRHATPIQAVHRGGCLLIHVD